MAKILYISNTDGALYVFRFPLLKALIERGHEVHAIITTSSPERSYISDLKDIGVSVTLFNFPNRHTSLLKAFQMVFKIKQIIQAIKPDIIHCFAHQANILGGIASLCSGNSCKLFFSVTGLGMVYTEERFKVRIVRTVLNFSYRFLSTKTQKIFFQNPDDMKQFISINNCPSLKTLLTNGSGLDPNYVPKIEPVKIQNIRTDILKDIGDKDSPYKIILFPARALFEKGVVEFYTAAKLAVELCPNLIFVHIGNLADNSTSGLTEDPTGEISNPKIIFLGHQANIFNYISASDAVVLPSYREGTPRSLIEALYMDKFIITTDAPGCKEVVVHDWNGLLVKVKSHTSLLEAFIKVSHLEEKEYAGRSESIFNSKYHSDHIVNITFFEYFSHE